ncbi:MAG: radical SAM family heme chaperone HemW [Bacillota bacterium]|nr:radical SAM family heme chaperone HemW [Bacillota bacterium]
MRGIYIHIPFCVSKCLYCDFNSYSGMADKIPSYVSALLKEAETYRGGSADTVYIGGGTPTFVPLEEMSRIIKGVFSLFSLDKLKEFTVEMNPRTANLSYLKMLKKLGVTRISLGAQSFDNNMLKSLGRVHTKEDIYDAVKMCFEAGFENVSLDLMFSLPNQTMDMWKDSLAEAVKCGVTHISCYGLKIEEGTPFFENGVKNLSDDVDREMYHFAISFLEKEGFEQYEISNFAKCGKYSMHNLKYWHCQEYYGLGAGAHSYLSAGKEHIRAENVKPVDEYINKITLSGNAIANKLKLSPDDMRIERIIMGLRLTEGISARYIDKEKLKKFISGGFMEIIGENIKFTTAGFDVSNAILCEII